MAQEALARLIAEAGIRRTLAEYCQMIDDGDFTALAGCFAPDAQLIAFGRTRDGRADVTALLAKVMTPEARGKHLIGNVIVRLADGQQADVASDFAFIGRDGSVQTGRYIDGFVAAGDRWLIARHEIVFTSGPS
jgi:ketosteroid isomerase-like protein